MISKKLLKFVGFFALTGIVACETEFSEVGSDVIGDDLFSFEKYQAQNLSAKTQEIGIVNTRNLPVNSLGSYTDIFGSQKAHIVTQLEMSGDNANDFTNITTNPTIDSVYIYIPYETSSASTNSDGSTSYELKNIFGNGSIDLKVFENKYLLTTADPGNNFNTQYYYSDQKSVFDSNKGNTQLNNSSDNSQNSEFVFSNKEIVLYQYNSDGTVKKDSNNQPIVKERIKPGLWLDLDKNYFQDIFFANNKYSTIYNNSILKEYFKGLYFRVDNNNGNALAQLLLTKGEFVIKYSQDKVSGVSGERESKTISLKMGTAGQTDDEGSTATSVNLFENIKSSDYDNALSLTNSPLIWLKGNNASYSKISVFGEDSNANGKPDELDEIIANEWKINQAVLTVSLEENLSSGSNKPERLFLYDIKNNTVLADYTIDQSTNPLKNIYGGLFNPTTKQYQFRITNYINNLVKNDSTNFDLGLVVANDISNTFFNVVKNETTKKIPLTSTMFPFGTVLYGPNHSDVNKKMKLEIYYAKQK